MQGIIVRLIGLSAIVLAGNAQAIQCNLKPASLDIPKVVVKTSAKGEPEQFGHQYLEDHRRQVPGGKELQLPMIRYIDNRKLPDGSTKGEMRLRSNSLCQFMVGEDENKAKFLSSSVVRISEFADEKGKAWGGAATGPNSWFRRLYVLNQPTDEELRPSGKGWYRREVKYPAPRGFYVEVYDYQMTEDLSEISAFRFRTFSELATPQDWEHSQPLEEIECGGAGV